MRMIARQVTHDDAGWLSCNMLQVAWSPMWAQSGATSGAAGSDSRALRFAMLAVGAKSGRVWLWRYQLPGSYAVRGAPHSVADSFALVSSIPG